MLISDNMVFAMVGIALVVGFLALQLGNELYKA